MTISRETGNRLPIQGVLELEAKVEEEDFLEPGRKRCEPAGCSSLYFQAVANARTTAGRPGALSGGCQRAMEAG